MMSDLHQWQRLAPVALVFLIVNGLQKFIRENLYLFVGAGAGAAFTEWMGWRELLLGILALLLILGVGAMVYHRRFRYRLEDDAVRVRRGLWVRRELRIRFARIQNIQISHPFYFQPFDLVRFSLETPGAAEKEVELPGIPRATAELLRDRIAEHLNGVDDGGPVADNGPEPEVLHIAGSRRLFAHGMASNQIWVLAGAAAYLLSLFRERIEDRLEDMAAVQWLGEQLQSAWFLIPVVLLIAVLLLQALSGLISIARFHGFRLIDRDDRVVATYGLLDRREKTVRREKITGLGLHQSMVGRLLGYWYLVVKQASSNEMDGEVNQQQLLVPGLRRTDLGINAGLLAGTGQLPAFERISPGFRQIFWVRVFVVIALGLLALAFFLGRDHWTVLVLAGLLPVVTGAIDLRWRHWGWALKGEMLWVRQGLLGQRFDVFALDLVQQVRVGQSPYQLRRDLANLELVLPQGSITVPYLPHDTASLLANRAIRAAETATMHRV